MLNRPQQLLFNQHVKDVFVTSITYRIIRNLRNYVSHYSILNIGVSITKNISGATSSAFYLSTAELLDWDEWDAEERMHLNNSGSKFEIEDLIKAYHFDFMQTQDKFFIEVVKNYYTALKSVVIEMEQLLIEGKTENMINSLPFKPSSIRYLKRILDVIDDK